jgi:DNA invertase Pin-like site-specific DNA recombinase
MIGAIAQFERELMLERQREGIAKAKAEGKYKGRAPTARAKAGEVRRLHGEHVGQDVFVHTTALERLIHCASLSPGSNGSFR